MTKPRYDGPMYASPLFDRSRIVDHAEFLPPGQVTALLNVFVRELEATPAAIARFFAEGDIAALRAAAHGFKGAAMSVGGARVAWIAAAFERGSPETMPPLLDALAACARDTQAEVLALVEALEEDARRAA